MLKREVFLLAWLVACVPGHAKLISSEPWRAADFAGAPDRSQEAVVFQTNHPGKRILTWDAQNRLVAMSERSFAEDDGYDWRAMYDAEGRRLRSTWTPVTNGVPVPAATQTVDSFFDPSVEFLEVGATVRHATGTNVSWKVHGPDLDGNYGGLNGIGGLDAVIADGAASGVVNDHFGNVVGWIGSPGGAPVWNPCRVTGYGAAPMQVWKALGPGIGVAEASVWRTRRVDPTGLVWMGARYYEPQSGRFVSADPLGHGASWSLYDYAGGDPVNRLDPDGRLSAGAPTAVANNVNAGLSFAWDGFETLAYGAASLAGQQSGWGQQWKDDSQQFFGTLAGSWQGFSALANTSVSAAGGNQASQAALLNGAVGALDAIVGTGSGRSAWYQLSYTIGNVATAFAGPLVEASVLSKAPALRFVDDFAAARGTELTGIQLNKAIGDATSDAIAARFPFALREVPFDTVGGRRIADVVTLGGRNIAIESKVGRTVLSDSRVRQELARDWWIKRQGKVDDVVWEFTPSPITGKGGPDAALQQMLEKLGFGVRINQ